MLALDAMVAWGALIALGALQLLNYLGCFAE